MKVLLLLLLPLLSLAATSHEHEGVHSNRLSAVKPTCKDRSYNCAYWAGTNECNTKQMLVDCPFSCNQCKEKPTCADVRKQCAKLAGRGECLQPKKKKWMSLTCPVSCNQCKDKVPTPKSYNEEFCKSSPDHTMCGWHGGYHRAPGCQKGNFGFTDAGKKLIVDKHNELRSRVARGEEDRSAGVGGQPKAGNMRAVRWSEELAVVAQTWADQCIMGHDKDRNKLDGTYVGQNIFFKWHYWGDGTGTEEVMATMNDAVQLWYDEVKNFDSENLDPFNIDYKTLHYTQVAWADTEEIGCGRAYYMDERGVRMSQVTCNYAIGRSTTSGPTMYKVGEPCSSCPADYTCNSDKLCQAPAEKSQSHKKGQ